MATRAEINEKYGIVRLMTSCEANEQLSEEDAAMYERMVKMLIEDLMEVTPHEERRRLS